MNQLLRSVQPAKELFKKRFSIFSYLFTKANVVATLILLVFNIVYSELLSYLSTLHLILLQLFLRGRRDGDGDIFHLLSSREKSYSMKLALLGFVFVWSLFVISQIMNYKNKKFYIGTMVVMFFVFMIGGGWEYTMNFLQDYCRLDVPGWLFNIFSDPFDFYYTYLRA